MKQAYNRLAPKKPTNLSVNSDLLSKAKGLKINLSATLEHALADEVRAAEHSKWLKENETAIAACNHLVENDGLFSDSYRTLW